MIQWDVDGSDANKINSFLVRWTSTGVKPHTGEKTLGEQNYVSVIAVSFFIYYII